MLVELDWREETFSDFYAWCACNSFPLTAWTWLQHKVLPVLQSPSRASTMAGVAAARRGEAATAKATAAEVKRMFMS